jgi:hydroxyacylglutathione hydrolase
VLTHAHFDHLLGARELLDAFRVPFLVPAGEEAMLAQVPETVREWLGITVEPPPEPAGTLAAGDTVRVGPYTWQVVATPGHSPAGICLIGEKETFVGDTLFAGSIGRTDLTGGNYDTLMEGIRRHLLPLDDEMVIYPGHGPATTMGQERRYNPFVRELI